MKFYYLFSILLLVLLYITNATVIQKNNKRDEASSKSKRTETSDECKYINSMIGKDKSYNCCEYNENVYKTTYEISCENGHIVKM